MLKSYCPLYRAVYRDNYPYEVPGLLLPTISGCLLVVKSSVTMITLLLLPTISGCLRKQRRIWSHLQLLLPTISGCLRLKRLSKFMKKETLLPTISGCLLIHLDGRNEYIRIPLLPTISGCLHNSQFIYENYLYVIAHYIGLSTTIFSVVFH